MATEVADPQGTQIPREWLRTFQGYTLASGESHGLQDLCFLPHLDFLGSVLETI